MQFLDRIDERKRLTEFLDSADGGFACLYGRRRCGKTRLLEECLVGRDNAFYYLADRTERSAQISRFVREIAKKYPAMLAADGRDWGMVLDLWVAVTPQDSVLVLDEFPFLAEKDDALTSVLQRLIDANRTTARKIIICGSSQRMMQGFVLKASEPLYGRAKVILPIAPLDFEWLQIAFPKTTAFERLRLWAVWGGVPRYLELQSKYKDLVAALRDEVYSPLGVLRNEPEHLLLDDVGDVAQASTVLSFIGEGVHRVSELAGRLGRPVTDLARPIKRLVDLGLIVKDSPFGEGEKSKRSFYRIADRFLDFWFTFVRPNWSCATYLSDINSKKQFEVAFQTYLGKIWEDLVRGALLRRRLPGIACDWRKVGRWWGTGINRQPLEVDIVAESSDGRALLVGEAKLKLTKKELEHELAELKVKAQLLPFAKDYERVVVKMFVAQGGDFDCVDLKWVEN